VLIDWINRRQKAIDNMEFIGRDIAISIITEYEIIAGAKNRVFAAPFFFAICMNMQAGRLLLYTNKA